MMKTEAEILQRMARYCSQAERCVQDVRKKIRQAELSRDAENRILAYLNKENFINEERFCRSFVNDKFKFNGWGRIKICHELEKRGIREKSYSNAINSIDEENYVSVLSEMIEKKIRTLKGESRQEDFNKLYRFAVSKGFETPMIINILKEQLNKKNSYDENFD